MLPATIPQISPLFPHYQDQYRNNQLPHPYALRWYHHPKVGKGSLIDLTRFRVKGCSYESCACLAQEQAPTVFPVEPS